MGLEPYVIGSVSGLVVGLRLKFMIYRMCIFSLESYNLKLESHLVKTWKKKWSKEGERSCQFSPHRKNCKPNDL